MRLRRNAVWNVAEVLASSVVLFFLYKIILARLGVSALGVWSLVLATTSLARIADFGAAGGLGRYVALAQAEKRETDGALAYVETALLANAALYAALGIVLYGPAWWALGLVTDGEATAQARQLLPYAIASFVLMNLSAVVIAALVGFHRSDQKSMLALGGLAVQAAVALATVTFLELRGVALAQIAQHLVLCVGGWLLAVRAAEGRWAVKLPSRIRPPLLRELVGFGLKVQGLNLAAFLFEPAIKFVMSSVGGLAALGLFEMAQRLIQQVRQLIVAPSQNLTPMFTEAHASDRERLPLIYEKATALMTAAAVPVFAGLAVCGPVLSWLWIGHVDWRFVTYLGVLCVGWLVNTLSVPTFLIGLGVGRIRWNMAGSALMTVLGPTLGWFLAPGLGALGVAVSTSLALGLGSLVFMIMNCRMLGIPVLPRRSAYTAALSFASNWSR